MKSNKSFYLQGAPASVLGLVKYDYFILQKKQNVFSSFFCLMSENLPPESRWASHTYLCQSFSRSQMS